MRTETGCSAFWARMNLLLELHHVKVALTDTAVGTGPGVRHILPSGAGGNTVLRITLSFVVNVTANRTNPLLHNLPREKW